MMDGTEGQRVWVPDYEWRVLPFVERIRRRCRAYRCNAQPVAELMRWSYARNKAYPYGYCADHMYGRRMGTGVVQISVAAGSPSAERGYVGKPPRSVDKREVGA